MKTNVVLHVGYPKTGTTWLQRVVLPRHPELSLLRRATPGCGWIQSLLSEHAFDFDPAHHRAAIDASFAGLGERVAFISHEACLGDPFLGATNSETNASRLARVFPEARVLIVIREQAAMIDSLYRQYVQEGGAASPQQLFADADALRVRFSRGYLAYDRAIDLFARHFGRERVRVLLFEDLRESSQRFVDAICELAGVAPLPLAGLAGSIQNAGLTRASLELLRAANRVLASSFQPSALLPIRSRTLRRLLQRGLDPLLAQLLGPRPRGAVPERLRAELRDGYRAGNRRLRDEYGLAVEGAGYAL